MAADVPQRTGVRRLTQVRSGVLLPDRLNAESNELCRAQFLWGFPIRRFDFIGITEYSDCGRRQSGIMPGTSHCSSERWIEVSLRSRPS